MSTVPARIVFLAFIGLTGGIIYNALYLQDLHSAAGPNSIPMLQVHNGAATPEVPSQMDQAVPAAVHGDAASPSPEPARLPAVSTDLPPLPGQQVPEQLVKAVQRELAARGYSAGAADGRLRDETRSAVSAFEKDHGLTVTGLPSDDLLRQILLGDSVKPSAATGAVAQLAADDHSARGDTTVKAVQQILADLGYAPGPVDGAMGGSTERAISAFQRDRKIAVTGRITPEMLREIKRVTGRSLAEAGTILR
jgi:peptidoglycan hydrolase-like protein with peptidoglycan-binding domain